MDRSTYDKMVERVKEVQVKFGRDAARETVISIGVKLPLSSLSEFEIRKVTEAYEKVLGIVSESAC